jgi:hypothetical protein
MTNYSDNPGNVRVDFFKPSGKWYMTEQYDMSKFYHTGPTPIDAVTAMLEDSLRGRSLMRQFIVVVLEPYHDKSYPVVLVPEN